MYQCGSTTVLRWVGAHQGFGLLIALILSPATAAGTATSHFKERIGKLIWGPRVG